MKTRLYSILFVILLVVIAGLTAAGFTDGTAHAALTNVGIPAWCYTGIVHAGESPTLYCLTPPGSVTFSGGITVPNGYYFMITDWVISPYSSGLATGNTVEIDLKDGYGSGSYYAINHFRFMDGSTAGQHYFSPMWTLVAGHHLELAAQSNTQTPFEFRVNGFLTTNINYLPVVSSQ